MRLWLVVGLLSLIPAAHACTPAAPPTEPLQTVRWTDSHTFVGNWHAGWLVADVTNGTVRVASTAPAASDGWTNASLEGPSGTWRLEAMYRDVWNSCGGRFAELTGVALVGPSGTTAAWDTRNISYVALWNKGGHGFFWMPGSLVTVDWATGAWNTTPVDTGNLRGELNADQAHITSSGDLVLAANDRIGVLEPFSARFRIIDNPMGFGWSDVRGDQVLFQNLLEDANPLRVGPNLWWQRAALVDIATGQQQWRIDTTAVGAAGMSWTPHLYVLAGEGQDVRRWIDGSEAAPIPLGSGEKATVRGSGDYTAVAISGHHARLVVLNATGAIVVQYPSGQPGRSAAAPGAGALAALALAGFAARRRA